MDNRTLEIVKAGLHLSFSRVSQGAGVDPGFSMDCLNETLEHGKQTFHYQEDDVKIQTGLFFKSFLEVRSVVVSPVDEQCPPFRRRTTDQCQKKR